MIAFRVEIWCSGCGTHFGSGIPFQEITEAASRVDSILECAIASRWVRDGAAHFCPQCQIKRAVGPIIDCLAMSETRSELLEPEVR